MYSPYSSHQHRKNSPVYFFLFLLFLFFIYRKIFSSTKNSSTNDILQSEELNSRSIIEQFSEKINDVKLRMVTRGISIIIILEQKTE
jgi:hypothetical protein